MTNSLEILSTTPTIPVSVYQNLPQFLNDIKCSLFLLNIGIMAKHIADLLQRKNLTNKELKKFYEWLQRGHQFSEVGIKKNASNYLTIKRK